MCLTASAAEVVFGLPMPHPRRRVGGDAAVAFPMPKADPCPDPQNG